MKQIALYASFVTTSLMEAALFITTTTYLQLAIAVLFFLPLTYFAFKLFPRKTMIKNPVIQTIKKKILLAHPPSKQHKRKVIEISDIDKRAFLKIIGAAGLSFFISSLFSKKIDALIPGKSKEAGLAAIQDADGNIVKLAEPHPTDNYKVSEVDYGVNTYYGFIDRGEGWFIMKEDLNAGTFRYIKGETNFQDNWKKREKLEYDFFNQVFPKP